ncbi:hypothetical protein [Clostridium fungisolvens]|uniref:Zona occludens toxin N-terminal domain-containing protein n=1 Tax=Clostridium fungisolvens TaxID=1604897 RepID=A0A6V8SPL4_9CLOT|nr:hypothetical protein [Clostridium fungisolvens]GFP78555.1 hypothetical protein bsdtw1_04792 [Clostridium fungisolvens]
MKKKSIREFIKQHKFPILIDLLKWVLIDIRRAIKFPRPPHYFGIHLVVGLYGQGKTMALTEYLDRLRKKHGHDIYIATNYYYHDEDFHITHWKDLVKTYDKTIIFGYDEIQNDFNSRDYQNFPTELLTLLTQNRKGNGKQVVGTAQRYGRVDKVFRELSQYVWSCHTVFGRLTSVKQYDAEDYEMLLSTPDVKKRMRIRPVKKWKFVQDDEIRNHYNSYQMLESATSKEYITQTERYQKLI